MQIKGVDFLLTFKCPSKCRHCSYKAGPDRTGYIKTVNTKRYETRKFLRPHYPTHLAPASCY